ncbi:pyridoxal phosphate-dependent aminotransferase [Phaeobacter sp. 22II1-1F12B]|uniref:pyridoxal phosphate-dependent aminotransferase n=1 Tax=Phaeobacter sp. 22II1-1F12B TaxID=1317111 RepID=UPI000B51F028|nr:pyridoxal phosphate-dependent aminotransferase [Phaeobacter sp. 22II1-1F12B]OWU73156.1 aspartate aminotransferase [Phaeobacter sp. 22II1-1F12B]
MKLSHRITHINEGGSDGWEVFDRAKRMIADGIAVTQLTIGEHDIRTDPTILAAMNASATGGHTGYASVPGIPGLRDAVAARVSARTGVPTRRENVLITPGGQAGLFMAHNAVCNPGDVALFVDPYYATYPGTIRAAGAVARPLRTHARDAFLPQAEELAQLAKGAVSLLINSPNNPTGVVYDRETLEGIAGVCREQDLWLVSDEVYDTQVWKGEHISPRALPGMAERTLVIGSMSKSHAMTGSRCGWIVGPEEAIAALADLAVTTTYGVAGFVQDAALFALNAGEDFEEQIAAPFRRRHLLAQKVLGNQQVVGLLPSDGAMYLMLDIRSTGMSGEAFAYALLEEERIAVMPGESFGSAAAGHIRVAMTIADAEFEQALKRLCDFAATIPGRESKRA